MTERDYAPLSVACVRGLCDKIYEKRKFSGAEIEKMVKDFNDAKNTSQIKRLLRVLGHDLMSSTNPNVKNGALMGLSSVAVGLGKDSVGYLPELMDPVLGSFSEAECRVRYQAAEALFNIVKIARGAVLPHVPQIFAALARLASDPEPQVKQAAELLDRLLKDIVTESPPFPLEEVVSLIRERLYARGGGARVFVLSWLAVLDAAPQHCLASHVPRLLDGLLLVLADPGPEVSRMCDLQLAEFLRTIKKDPSRVEFPPMLNILIAHAQSPEEAVQLAALTWLREAAGLCAGALRAHVSGALAAALPCLAHHELARRDIRETAAALNASLMRLVDMEFEEPLEVPPVVEVLSRLLQAGPAPARAALDWLLHLYTKLPAQMCFETERVFPCAVARLTDSSDDVVRRALALLAEICSCHRGEDAPLECSEYYYRFLRALLRLFAADDNLLEDRGAFIIRQLCVLLPAEEVYFALGVLLQKESSLPFVSAAVRVLSSLLLTAAELHDLRAQLRAGQQSSSLLVCLYRCWSHSPVSLVSLCLLTHNYAHCTRLLKLFGELEITVDLLTEIDKLVQLIESPIFAYLRLELLEAGGGSLRASLYALLMLLPQSDAFHTLRRRLQCVPTRHEMAESAEPESASGIDFAELLDHFKSVQTAHREYRMVDRSRPADNIY